MRLSVRSLAVAATSGMHPSHRFHTSPAGAVSQAGYSGAEVIPGTEPVAGPIQSRTAIGWR